MLRHLARQSSAASSSLSTAKAVVPAIASHDLARHIRSKSTTTSVPTSSTIPDAASSEPLLQVSTLPNGVRVATDGTPGHFVAAGVYLGAGSRFEWEGNSGSSHMLDRLAFKSTRHRTAEQMTNEIEGLGGQFLASSSREVIMYQASSYTHALPSVMSLLSDTVLHPTISSEELELQRQSAAWELQEIHNKPEMILPELLYEVAFQGNTLGNPLLIQQEKLQSIDNKTIKDFRRQWFRPERMVVAGAGIPHQQLLELAQEHFSSLEASPTSKASSLSASSSSSATRNIPTHLLHPNSASSASSRSRGKAPYATASDSFHSSLQPSFEELADATPVYTGGEVYDTSRADSMEFSHLFVGYEGLSIHDPDVYALATLQMLLGGGSSFSAGGPGKGMFSRLYTNLLNRYHDVEHCSAFHHCYLDTGLFAMCISVNPHFISRAPQLIAEQLSALMDEPSSSSYSYNRRIVKGVTDLELSRAKNQLKSSLVMALESRLVQVEDLGRQVLAHNKKVPIEEMLEKIDEVHLPDLRRVARRVFRPTTSGKADLVQGEYRSGEPSILAAGKLDGLGDVKDVLRRYGLAP